LCREAVQKGDPTAMVSLAEPLNVSPVCSFGIIQLQSLIGNIVKLHE